MHFVKKKQRVAAEKARVHGTHTVAHAVATEEETRADLVDGACSDDRHLWPLGPCIVAHRSAAEHGQLQKRGSWSDDLTKTLCRLFGCRGGGGLEGLRDLHGSRGRLAGDDTPLTYE